MNKNETVFWFADGTKKVVKHIVSPKGFSPKLASKTSFVSKKDWKELNEKGVLAIVVYRSPNWILERGSDFYIFTDSWYGVDYFGALRFLESRGLISISRMSKQVKKDNVWVEGGPLDVYAIMKESKRLLFGEYVSGEIYDKAIREAREEVIERRNEKGQRLQPSQKSSST